jgi:hypothetical protein
VKRIAEWLRVGLASPSFWRRAISITVHATAGRFAAMAIYVVVVLVYFAVFE